MARFKRDIPAVLEGNEYGKRLYAMFEKNWKLDADPFWWDNIEVSNSTTTVRLDSKNKTKAIMKFIDWMEGQFGQAVAEEMFTEQLANGQGQVESAAALRSQQWHATQLYAKKTTTGMVREGVAALTGPYGSAVNGLAHAAQGNYEAALMNAVPLTVHGVAGVLELTPELKALHPTVIERVPRHHVFPQESVAWFKSRGFDINKYTVELDQGTHSALHTMGWNEEIMNRLNQADKAKGSALSESEILDIGKKMLSDYKIKDYTFVPFHEP